MSDVTTVESNTGNVAERTVGGKWQPRFESPLHHVEILGQQVPAPTVFINEEVGLSHLVLRGNPANPEFIEGARKALGLGLPLEAGASSENDTTRVFWLAPDEWLVIGERGKAADIEQSLRQNLEGHFAVTDVSGGQTLVTLSGPNAMQVLKKSTPYDVDMRKFPVGKCIGTVLAKAQVQMRRVSEDSVELIIRRSFADYLWLWLVDASREYGLAYK
ncbi:sarcosine oxidase subunit gamma family protein [Parasalinivibrio latis]|uniref:sarcosine oxidase subunit gamma n=1 Tax=Parasalinivibrio latis TaxID=2952610 RepID=UPI0030DF7437